MGEGGVELDGGRGRIRIRVLSVTKEARLRLRILKIFTDKLTLFFFSFSYLLTLIKGRRITLIENDLRAWREGRSFL